MNKQKTIYSMDLKEYKELFQVKYSFYSLMRRIFSWFERNDNDDLKDSFTKFKNHVAGTHGGKFNLDYQFMFFSDDFILETFYDINDKKLITRGLSEKYQEREKKITEDFRQIYTDIVLNEIHKLIYEYIEEGCSGDDIVERIAEKEILENNTVVLGILKCLVKKCVSKPKYIYSEEEFYVFAITEYHNLIGLRKITTNNVDSTFIKVSRDDAQIPNKYYDIIINPEQRKQEEERIVELVKEWIPSKYLQEVIEEVIESDYLKRHWVSARWKGAENQCGNDDLPAYFYIEDDFFCSAAAVFDESYKCDVYYGMTLDRLCDLLELTKEQKEKEINKDLLLHVVEKNLQDLFDFVKHKNKSVVLDVDNRVVIGNREERFNSVQKYPASTLLEKRFNDIKNEDPYKYIAKIIMTSLCTHNVKEALLHIWDISEFSQKRIGMGANSYEQLISDITFPFITNEDRCKCIIKLASFNSEIPFYDCESEYCFLNIYVYENWGKLQSEFPKITDVNMLLYNAYNHLYKYKKSQELDFYIKKYEGFYIKNSFRKVILELGQQWFETNARNKEFSYDSLYDFITYFCNDNEVMLFESKLKMTDVFSEYDDFHKDYKSACEGLMEVYKDTKEEFLIPLIIKCLSELNDDDLIAEYEVKELRDIWIKIETQNGNQEEIRRLYSQYCIDKLSERKEKIKKEKKLDFCEISKSNYRNYTLDEAKEDIYVVLGYGRASETFIRSIKNKEDCAIYVVPQKNEIIEGFIPPYVRTIKEGFDSIYQYLPVYNLDTACLENENAFDEYINQISRIHLVALGDDKRENLRNVVDFIEVTWQHYVLYEYMVKFCTKIDIKIDFKEVDIVVDAYEYETSYIDSIMNRLDNDFYIRINYVNYRKEIAKELVTEFPLFMVDMQESKLNFKINSPTLRDDTRDNMFVPGDTMHNVVLLGDEQKFDAILEVIKEIIRVSGYGVIGNDLGEFSKKNASMYEGKIGENFRLTIFSKNADAIKERLMYEAPDLFESANRSYLHNVEPEFINLDPESYRFIKLFDEIKKIETVETQSANVDKLNGKKEVPGSEVMLEGINAKIIRILLDEIQKEKQEIATYNDQLVKNQFDIEVSERLREATYFICMLKDDATSYMVATRIRQACYRIDKSMKHVPIITALCENGYSDTDYNSFIVGIDEEKPVKYKDPWWRRYEIYSFGSFDKCYSYANLYENYLSKIAWRMHVTDKEGNKYLEKVRAYFKNYYNFKACEERAVTIPYVFYSILCEEMCDDCSLSGEFDGLDNHWSMELFEKYIDKYIELYKEKVLLKDSNGEYTDSIESNVILWLAVLEKNRFNVNLTLDGYTSAINGVENKSLFEEYIQGWKSRDVENSLGDKLHIAKLHGDITTWEFSSGKEYDSKYVRDLAIYLERDVLATMLTMKGTTKTMKGNEERTK